MYTNQDAAPHQTEALHACSHTPGTADPDTCRYLYMLEALRAWIERAESAHAVADCGRERVGELWVLQAQLSYAHDHCPNHAALEPGRTDPTM